MNQILQLDPKLELRFRGPFDEIVSATLKLSNPSDKRVCFKVKTTVPKRYCVRPNCGVVEPKNSVTVQVMLQPFEYDPQERNKHKFMVQSMYAPEGAINHEIIWKDAPKDQLMDSKLRCAFEMPDEPEMPLIASTRETANEEFVPSVQQQMKSVEPITSAINSQGGDSGNENKRLKDEVRDLRKEIAKLQEDGIRQRHKGHVSDSSSPKDSRKESVVVAGQFPPMTLLVYGLILIFVGFILGKYIF